MVSGCKFRQPLRAVERFHLPKLHDQHRRPGGIQLLWPTAKIHFTPLLINRVRLPRHKTETRFLLRKTSRQHRLHHARFLFANQIFLTDKNDHLVAIHRESAINKTVDRLARLAYAKPAVNLIRRRNLCAQ